MSVVGINAASSELNFNPVKRGDLTMQQAYASAARTINTFIKQIKTDDEGLTYMAKLRFRDPGLSEQTGQDEFMYLWLNEVVYHDEDQLLSGVFFELPVSLNKWHQVGQRLAFEPADVFDWMINDQGKIQGGFTIRVARNRLSSEEEKIEFDEYIGISSYEPKPE